jgi:Ca2+/Na+ antiporter
VVDNIIGSNIDNALLILGIAGIVAKTLKIGTSLIDVDLPFFFMSMALFGYFSLDQLISLTEGIALLTFFIIFIIYNVKQKPEKKDEDEMEDIGARIIEALERTPRTKRRLVLGRQEMMEFREYIRLPESIPLNVDYDDTQEHRLEFI